jgi:hypothetical protein
MSHKSTDVARHALAALPRCGAKSRQTGEPCKLAGTGNGGRCRFHGGRAGRKPTHGRRTQGAQRNTQLARLLCLCLHSQIGDNDTRPRFRLTGFDQDSVTRLLDELGSRR